MPLAIFDLDNTLLNGDSDYLWGQFLVEKGIVDGDEYEEKNKKYYQAYLDGSLDILEFLRFSLHPLTLHDTKQLNTWHQQFMQEKIQPIILDTGRALLEKHRKQGNTLLIITATNLFITGPICRELGVEHVIATEPEMLNKQYTGNISGTPCFREGKVERLEQWMVSHNEALDGSWFYSDSHNDIPLLEKVSYPVATDPDEQLKEYAKNHSWQIISLR